MLQQSFAVRTRSEAVSRLSVDLRQQSGRAAMSNAAATEKQVPTALIIAGAGLWVLPGFMGNGVRGASNALAAVGLIATVNVVLMIAGAFLTPLVLRISFGDLQSAILTLGAIALFPGAVGYLIPGVGADRFSAVLLAADLVF